MKRKGFTQFHCFRCGKIVRTENDEGIEIYADGYCGECGKILKREEKERKN